MKPTTVLTSSGRKRARDRVGARLQRLLVDAVVRVGRQRGALAGLEIHHVVAHRAALQRQRRRRAPRAAAPASRRSCALAASVPAIDWNTRSTGTPALDQRERGGDVGQHAGLRRDARSRRSARRAGAAARDQLRRAVGRRVDADHRVAAAVHQAVEDARPAMPRGSSVGWLGCSRTASVPGRPSVLRKRVTTAALAGDQDQVLVAHDLADRRRHLGRQAGRERGQRRRRGRVRQQPVAEAADRQVARPARTPRRRGCRRSGA